MMVIKKIDDIGRIAIPKDIRRSLRWMGGDEIEIISSDDGSVLLRKHGDDTTGILRELKEEWSTDSDIEKLFLELIDLIEKKTK